MAMPEFTLRLTDPYPRLIDRWVRPRVLSEEEKTYGKQGKIRHRRESKREYTRRIAAQAAALAGEFYDILEAQFFVANPTHARNDFLRFRHDQGESYEHIRRTYPEAAGLSRSGVRAAINESRVRLCTS